MGKTFELFRQKNLLEELKMSKRFPRNFRIAFKRWGAAMKKMGFQISGAVLLWRYQELQYLFTIFLCSLTIETNYQK